LDWVFFLPQPFRMAALFPFGKVLFCDSASAKLFLEDSLHAGQTIEPFHQFLALFTIFNAMM